LKSVQFPKPIVGIGGINKERVLSVLQSGADCVCITSAITLSIEPKIETKEIKKIINHYKNEKK
jgi:thiamine monophosphate synthase